MRTMGSPGHERHEIPIRRRGGFIRPSKVPRMAVRYDPLSEPVPDLESRLGAWAELTSTDRYSPCASSRPTSYSKSRASSDQQAAEHLGRATQRADTQ